MTARLWGWPPSLMRWATSLAIVQCDGMPVRRPRSNWGHLGNLGPEPMFFQMQATVINDHGTIFGWVHEYDEQDDFLRSRAVRWDAGTTEATALAILQDGSNEFSSLPPAGR